MWVRPRRCPNPTCSTGETALADPAQSSTTAPHPKRVLVIAYEFPPLAAGGINRTVKFARYLRRFGWQPLVLTTRNPEDPVRDPTMLDDLPADLPVHRTTSWEYHGPRDRLVGLARTLGGDPERWRRGLGWRLRGLWSPLARPDHKIYWAAPAILTGVALVLRHRIDAIYSTSWPYSDHMAALAISRLTGRPFIADFRDPWTQHMNYRPQPPGWDWTQRRLERAVCAAARFVITPTRRATAEMRRLFADLPRTRFVTIRNGFDPADFQGQVEPLGGFELVHAGTFHKSRQPDVFLRGLAEFLDRVPEARAHTRVRLFGMSLGDDLSRFAGRVCVETHSWAPHQQVVRAFRESSVLLLIMHREKQQELAVPGKAYEYMATGNHVLAFEVPPRELGRLLRAYGNATILPRYEAGPIAEVLEGLYQRWRGGDLTARAAPPFVQRLSRVERTRELASLLSRAVGAEPLPSPRWAAQTSVSETPPSLPVAQPVEVAAMVEAGASP